MAKFNRTTAQRPAPTAPIRTEQTPSTRTYNGAPGFLRDERSELFLLGVSNMVGENTFYEKAGDRDLRYEQLVRNVAISYPVWMREFLYWLRSEGNMRSASLVGAVEAADAMVTANVPGSRKLVSSVLQRGDEPSEVVAYWRSTRGRKLMPKPLKRGVADAAQRLFTQRNTLKYDTESHAVRFATVIQLARPKPQTPQQSKLFKLILNRRYGDTRELLESLEADTDLQMMLNQQALRATIQANPGYIPTSDEVAAAGMTWEAVLSLLGSTVDKAKLWEAMIPSMGYMATIRNLRNFDEAGISKKAVAQVLDKLTNPKEVAKSRQFPYRFLAAYEAVHNLRWGPALDEALNLSLQNLPELRGRTLVLIDTSSSMTTSGFSAKSTMTPAKAAAVFGVALAIRNNADLYGFANHAFAHKVPKGASLISEVTRFIARTGEAGHGTEIAGSLRQTYAGHDRVFILSDMQTTGSGTSTAVPADVPIYGFNLNGYKAAAMPTGSNNRYEFGGMSDSVFKVIPLLEANKDGCWPWELKTE